MESTRGVADVLAAARRVALADGVGMPMSLGGLLTDAARRHGAQELLLGWCLGLPPELDLSAFDSVRTFMGGSSLQHAEADGIVTYMPVRLGAMPALLVGPLRADVVVVSVRPSGRGFAFCSEVAWMPAAIAGGAVVVAEVNHGLPLAGRGTELRTEDVVVASEVNRPPLTVAAAAPTPSAHAIGALVASLVPEGAVVQYGPGAIGEATLRSLEVPVEIDSGLLTDAAMSLGERSLLRSPPRAAYLVGTSELYEWADGQPLLERVEHTHDISRLASQPLYAVNAALQIDHVGQVNVEGFPGALVAGIGGHADFCTAAGRAEGGLSIIALPSRRAGRSTLVETLRVPTSTARSDVDVVVNEHGMIDLRGFGDDERRRGLLNLWSRSS